MSENKLPAFDSVEELADFFDKTDMGDFDLPEAHFEIELRPQNAILVEPELLLRLQSIAAQRQVTSEALINEWLEEKVAQAA